MIEKVKIQIFLQNKAAVQRSFYQKETTYSIEQTLFLKMHLDLLDHHKDTLKTHSFGCGTGIIPPTGLISGALHVFTRKLLSF